MNYKDKAEEYVRQRLPELMELSFGCEVDTGVPGIVYELRGDTVITLAGGIRFSNKLEDLEASKHWKIIGHPIQLQHWLRALKIIGSVYMEWHGGDNLVISICDDGIRDTEISLNLTTGKPAAEEDYKNFVRLLV